MKTFQEPSQPRSTYQIHSNPPITTTTTNSSPFETPFNLPKPKPTYDYIADIKQINDELLSTNTTNISTAKHLHHNTSTNSFLKIDDCSDIEGHPSSFIKHQPSSSPRTSTLLSELTTNKINKYFNDTLMSKLRSEYTQNEQQRVCKQQQQQQRKQKCLFVKPLLTDETQRTFVRGSSSSCSSNCNEEELAQLKCVVNSYKKLLDTLFYFVNSLSHNYTFEKKFYQMSSYVNKEDELMKELLVLERCLQSNVSANWAEKKQQEIMAKLYITQEHSLTIHTTTLNNNINEGGVINNIDDCAITNVVHKKEYTTAVTRNKNNRKRKPTTTTTAAASETKCSKECLACTLGASISKRGYSPMKFNPYKHHHSFNLKNTRSTSH